MVEIIAELATSFHGNVELGKRMIAEAAKAGASTVKTQAYYCGKINPNDPQAQWLRESWLSPEGHRELMKEAADCGVGYFSTPFCADSLQMLRDLGLRRFKIASSEAWAPWIVAKDDAEQWIVSYPWGIIHRDRGWHTQLTAIPLYPTPLECVGRATLLDGWSDHCEGTAVCLYALARGAKVVEAHFTIPGARSKPWDKSAAQIREIRQFAEACATIQTGVSQVFRDRWTA